MKTIILDCSLRKWRARRNRSSNRGIRANENRWGYL